MNCSYGPMRKKVNTPKSTEFFTYIVVNLTP